MGEKHNFIWGINACMQRFGMILFRIFLKRSWRNGMFLPSLLHTHESSLHKHAFSLSKWKCCDSNVLAFLSRALIQGFSMFSNTAHPFMSSSFFISLLFLFSSLPDPDGTYTLHYEQIHTKLLPSPIAD